MITLSIDVKKLDKSRFKEITRKSGEPALFCDLILIESQSDYGDYMVKQSMSKEERENNLQLPIIGNGKIVKRGEPAKANPPAPRIIGQVKLPEELTGDDIPF
jgi:hypothetical protein